MVSQPDLYLFGMVAAVELARPSTRAAFASLSGVAYGLGGVLFAALAWRVRHWRRLLLLVHGAALLLPLYRLLVDESARWLHATGRRRDAARVLRKAARWNKVYLFHYLTIRVQIERYPPTKCGVLVTVPTNRATPISFRIGT